MVFFCKTLCLILSIISTVQLTITIIILLTFAEILSFAKIVYTITWALVASTITLSSTTQMRSTHVMPKMEKMYGYTACYQKLTMSVSLLSHLLVVVLAVAGTVGGKSYSTDFFKLMKFYGNKQSSKTFVDEVQMFFQCCGSQGFNDWCKVQWQNHKKIKRRAETWHLLFAREAYNRKQAVPYSCCSKESLAPCKHGEPFDKKTINAAGCAYALEKHIEKQLFLQLSLSGTCITIDILVLVMLFKTYKSETNFMKSKWKHKPVILNESSSLTEIIPGRKYSE